MKAPVLLGIDDRGHRSASPLPCLASPAILPPCPPTSTKSRSTPTGPPAPIPVPAVTASSSSAMASGRNYRAGSGMAASVQQTHPVLPDHDHGQGVQFTIAKKGGL